jgi:opacity protein-like surface antigen
MSIRHFAVTTVAIIALVLIPLDTSRAETRLGIKGGVTFASYDLEAVSPGVELGNREGFAVGLEVQYSFSPWLRLFVEPSYVEKGARVDFPPEFSIVDNTQIYDYIMVPVGVKAMMTLGPLQPFGVAGVGLGFVVNNETEFDYGDPGGLAPVELDDTDITIEVGAGAEIPANEKLAFTVEGRYSLGMASISGDDRPSVHTRTISVLGGLCFRL